jgi:hypothetical protein
MPKPKSLEVLTPHTLQDVMVDLETTGNRPGCGILSLGAVMFNPHTGEMGDEFYRVIQRKTCIEAGLFEQEDTLAWWAKQSPEAQKVLKKAATQRAVPTLKGTLNNFAEFLKPIGKSRIRIWGCGSDFDNVILAHAYHATGIDLPWMFWNNRCYRTLRSLAPTIELERIGVFHNALDDAKTQAAHLVKVYSHLKLKASKPKPKAIRG